MCSSEGAPFSLRPHTAFKKPFNSSGASMICRAQKLWAHRATSPPRRLLSQQPPRARPLRAGRVFLHVWLAETWEEGGA
jgi:hypothetical protein